VGCLSAADGGAVIAVGVLLRAPRAVWSSNRAAHLRWRWRVARANAADRCGRPFTYEHSTAGPLLYHPSDYLSRRLYLYDDFEHRELRFAIDRARGGGLILDVGANIGLYTAACARAAGTAGRVIALEPGPTTFEKLEETCRQLHLTNVTALKLAASRAAGVARLAASRSDREVQQRLIEDAGDAGVPVQTCRLDDVCGDDVKAVTLLKIDVEGHEVAALEGAERILTNRRAHLIVEFYAEGLRAAQSSLDALWTLLARTHACIGVIAADGSALAAARSSVETVGPEETRNTLWVPRAGGAAC
jgi:FkbM family methyltransferase